MSYGEQSSRATPNPILTGVSPELREEEGWVKIEVKKNLCEEDL
jgi:hypothetical protein